MTLDHPPSPVLRLFHTTPLGSFCRHPEIALALAQDKLAAQVAPFVQVPDLLGYEERLFEDWLVERPEAAAQAAASAAQIEQEWKRLGPAAVRLRATIRRSALRRLDAAAVGREVFQPCAAFCGEPHLPCELEDGFVLKIGIVRMANYWPKPEGEARSALWRQNEILVRSIETNLFPLLPPPGPNAAEEFAAAAELWLRLEPLRAFEAHRLLPLFPHSTIYPEGYVPRGYRIRISAVTMRELSGSYLTLVSAGLSPYIAEPFLEFCETRREMLGQWARDPEDLAVAKWGTLPDRGEPPLSRAAP